MSAISTETLALSAAALAFLVVALYALFAHFQLEGQREKEEKQSAAKTRGSSYDKAVHDAAEQAQQLANKLEQLESNYQSALTETS